MEESKYLSEIEQDKITAFLNDKILVAAVRKVMLKRVYTDGILEAGKDVNPYENFFMNIYKDQSTGEEYTDSELGQITRAKRKAIELIQVGFKDLENFKKVEVIRESDKVNKAR